MNLFDQIRESIMSIGDNRDSRQRSYEMLDLGNRLGFGGFTPNRDDGFLTGWNFLSRLNQGDDRFAFNILQGVYHDQPLYIFDHHYRIGSGKNQQDYYCTRLMLIEKQAFPQTMIGRENLRDKFATAFGIGNEIKFELMEFSRAFAVRSQDKKFAYDVCNPQMMEYLLANRDLQIEINGPVISLAFEPLLPVDQIELNLQRLAQIRSLMPDYLFTQNA